MNRLKKFSFPAVVFLTVALCTACGRFPTKMDITDQSVGPIASPDFQNLIRESIPQAMGEARVFGMAHWMGFSVENVKFSVVEPFYKGVVALTDTDILLLSWSEDQQHYEVLENVAYSNIRYLPSSERQSLHLKLLEPTLTLGGVTYLPWKTTYLEFVMPKGVFTDRENLKRAHALLEEKVEQFEIEKPVTSYPENHQ